MDSVFELNYCLSLMTFSMKPCFRGSYGPSRFTGRSFMELIKSVFSLGCALVMDVDGLIWLTRPSSCHSEFLSAWYFVHPVVQPLVCVIAYLSGVILIPRGVFMSGVDDRSAWLMFEIVW